MSKNKQMPGMITGLIALLAVAAFFIISFTGDGWDYAWIVFLAIPLGAVITNIIYTKKDRLNLVIGAVAIACAITFLLLGILGHLWSFAWIIFLLIPITSIIINMIKTVRNDKQGKSEEQQEKEEK